MDGHICNAFNVAKLDLRAKASSMRRVPTMRGVAGGRRGICHRHGALWGHRASMGGGTGVCENNGHLDVTHRPS